jgi:hypothetical protein
MMRLQNVWPLLYKPAFHASTVSRALLLSMLAAAAVIPGPPSSSSSGTTSVLSKLSSSDQDRLFREAQAAVIHSDDLVAAPASAGGQAVNDQYELQPIRPQIHVVQCLILFSLRQTTRGNKGSAYMWACKAFGMALELGLHRAAPIGGNRLSQVGALRMNPSQRLH